MQMGIKRALGPEIVVQRKEYVLRGEFTWTNKISKYGKVAWVPVQSRCEQNKLLKLSEEGILAAVSVRNNIHSSLSADV